MISLACFVYFALTFLADSQDLVPVIFLSSPEVEFPEGFTNLLSLRELPDRRILTIEECERAVYVLDMATGAARQVGSTGGGPNEYRRPSRLLPFLGDSTLIYDAANRRFLLLGPDASPKRVFEAPMSQARTRTSNGGAFFVTPTATDRFGRIYGRGSGIRLDQSVPIRLDSLAILRWDPRTDRRDSIAFVRLAEAPGPIVVGRSFPFAVGTQWAVAEDGRIGLVYPGDYHVEYLLPGGQRIRGAKLPFEPIPLNEEYKMQWRQDQHSRCPSGVIVFVGRDGRRSTAIRARQEEPREWPSTLPPIRSGGIAFAPNGLLWVRRNVTSWDQPAFDLISESGQVVQRVVLPKRTHLLGFGRESVYLGREDEENLLFVQRHKLPSRGPR